MYKLKVIVDKLNIRNSPAADPTYANWIGESVMGDTIQATEKICGSVNENISDWYKDDHNRFLWGGGVSAQEDTLGIQEGFLTAKVDYNTLVKAPDEWNNLGGKDIYVAIMDTGCSMHDALKDSISYTYNVLDKSNDVNDISVTGHGTFVSGIIAAHNDSEVGGIAQNVQLIIVKVAKEEFGITANNVCEGLTWLAFQCPVKPHIINMSLQFAPGELSEQLNELLMSFSDSGTKIYSGAQNDDDLGKNIFYPGSNEYVIAVGALSSKSAILENGFPILAKVKYIIPNISYHSLGTSSLTPYTDNKGCSFATASLSGLTALAMSYYNFNKVSAPLSDFLNQAIDQFQPSNFSADFKIYKYL